MAAFEPALVEATRDALCTALEGVAAGVGIGANVYDSIGFGAGAAGAGAAAQLWRNASNAVCGRPPEDVSSQFPVPFQGGQCEVQYVVVQGDWSYSDNDGNVVNRQGSPTTFQGPGPLSFEVDKGGQRQRLRSSGGGFLRTLDVSGFGSKARILTRNWQISRADGAPDDCGNPPPANPSFNPNDYEGPMPFEYDGPGGPIQVNPDVRFGPLNLSPTGEFSVPINVDFGIDGPIVGEFNFSTGDINFGANNSGGDGVSVEPVAVEPGEEPPPGIYKLVGVRVIASFDPNVSRATEIFQEGGNPDIYVPRLGHVAFEYDLPGGGVAWESDVSVKVGDQVVWATRPARRVRATPNMGSVFALTELYEEVPDDCCFF